MSDEAKFWDKRAEKYSKRAIGDQESYQKKLDVTRKYLSPDSEVLEWGCGTGSTALELAPDVKHILATDISSEMIRIAQGKATAEQIENVTFETGAIDNWAHSDSRYDVVLAHNLLHLLDERKTAIEGAFQVLKPGGVFITSTACIGDMSWIFRIIAPIGGILKLIPLINVFTQDQLRQSLTDAGFIIDHEWRPKKNAAAFIVAQKLTSKIRLPLTEPAELQ